MYYKLLNNLNELPVITTDEFNKMMDQIDEYEFTDTFEIDVFYESEAIKTDPNENLMQAVNEIYELELQGKLYNCFIFQTEWGVPFINVEC